MRENLMVVSMLLPLIPGAGAAPASVLDFNRLIADSDLICVGVVESVSDLGTVQQEVGGRSLTVDQKRAAVHCERVLQARYGPELSSTFSLPIPARCCCRARCSGQGTSLCCS